MKCLYPNQCGIGHDCSKCYQNEIITLRKQIAMLNAALNGMINMGKQEAKHSNAWSKAIEISEGVIKECGEIQ